MFSVSLPQIRLNHNAQTNIMIHTGIAFSPVPWREKPIFGNIRCFALTSVNLGLVLISITIA